MLGCCEPDPSESWLHYKLALERGGLSSPEIRRAALLAGRGSGEGNLAARLILTRVGLIERLVLRTRMVHLGAFFGVVATTVVLAGGLGLARMYGGALAVLGLSTLALAWWVISIAYTCWQPRAVLGVAALIPISWGPSAS